MQFGLGRWDKIRASLRPPSLEKRDVEDCVLASWDFVRAVADRCAGREARYLAARLKVAPKVEHHPDPLVGPWSNLPRNASQWARRLRLLDDVNRAAERCVAEETQDEALATFATMPDPKLPPWWNPDCDLFLLCGAREHGFGKYDETLRDATCAPGFKRAARDFGPEAEAALLASERASQGKAAKAAAARRMSLTSADEGEKAADEEPAETANANGDADDDDANDSKEEDSEDDSEGGGGRRGRRRGGRRVCAILRDGRRRDVSRRCPLATPLPSSPPTSRRRRRRVKLAANDARLARARARRGGVRGSERGPRSRR